MLSAALTSILGVFRTKEKESPESRNRVMRPAKISNYNDLASQAGRESILVTEWNINYTMNNTIIIFIHYILLSNVPFVDKNGFPWMILLFMIMNKEPSTTSRFAGRSKMISLLCIYRLGLIFGGAFPLWESISMASKEPLWLTSCLFNYNWIKNI